MKRRSEPTDPTALTPLRVLVVEDDDFQLTIACMTLETAARGAGVALSIETSDTGLFALEECRSHQQPFDLVLMDFILSDHTASSHLPAIRAQLGQTAAIVMLSAADEELQLTRCLDLGADAYRIKPLTFNMAVELFSYGREKRDFFRKRRRTLHPSVTESETELALGGSASPLRDPEEPDAPGRSFTMLSAGDNVFAFGRRSPVHLGMWQASAEALGNDAAAVSHAHGGPQAMVAIKTCHRAHLRGPPPPPHPHVNHVLQVVIEGERAYVARQLCEGGELFPLLKLKPPLSLMQALRWFAQLTDAVAHCHTHGAAHGQFRAENCLLRLGRVQLVGFSRIITCPSLAPDAFVAVDPIRTPSTEAALAEAPAVEPAVKPAVEPASQSGAMIELRPCDPMDAPELHGRRHASATELFACDIWSLGVLLVGLLTGEPSTRLPDGAHAGGGGVGVPVANRPRSSGMRKVASVGTELSLGIGGMMRIGADGPALAPPTVARPSSPTVGLPTVGSPTAGPCTAGPCTARPCTARPTAGFKMSRSVVGSLELAGVSPPSEVEALVGQMLSPDPESRPSAAEILAQLRSHGFM